MDGSRSLPFLSGKPDRCHDDHRQGEQPQHNSDWLVSLHGTADCLLQVFSEYEQMGVPA